MKNENKMLAFVKVRAQQSNRGCTMVAYSSNKKPAFEIERVSGQKGPVALEKYYDSLRRRGYDPRPYKPEKPIECFWFRGKKVRGTRMTAKRSENIHRIFPELERFKLTPWMSK